MLYEEIKKYPVLSAEEQRKLAKNYQESGNREYFDKLVHHNLRLCLKQAHKYHGKLESMTFLDLFQECSLILMNAIENYNPDKEANFSTYAVSSLEKTLKARIFNFDKTIREPVYKEEQKVKYKQFITKYNQIYHRNPEPQEIQKELGLNEKQLKKLEMSLEFKTVSLDKKISTDEDSTDLIELIPNDENNYQDIEINYDLNILKNKCIQILNKQEYYLIYYRYISDEKKTLEQLSKEFNLSSEGIRQKLKKALKKLKEEIESINLKTDYTKPLDPISIDTIMILFELKKCLSTEEYLILYSIIVKSTDISTENHLNDLHIVYLDKTNLLPMKKYLLEIFQQYQKEENLNVLRKHYHKKYTVAQLLELDINIRTKDLMDFQQLEKYFQSLDIEKIEHTEYYKNLSLKDQQLIQKYYIHNHQNLSSRDINQIEEELTLEKQGYLEKEKPLYNKKQLQEMYIKHNDSLTEKEKEILGAILFHHPYSSPLTKATKKQYINRLIKIHFKIADFYQNKITKTQIKKTLKSYPDFLSQDEKELIDKSYGINQDQISLVELSKKYDMSYEQLHDKVFNLKNKILYKYYRITEGKKDDISKKDKQLYQMYLSNEQYEFSKDVRRIFGLFLSGKNYQEIATLEQLSVTKVSNFVTEGIRKCEFYKYGIITPLLITEEEINKVSQINHYSAEEQKLIKERYLKLTMPVELEKIYNINKLKIIKINEKFYSQYLQWKCPKILISQYEEEIKKHRADSILTKEEKTLVALKYGIKCNYNPDGKKQNMMEIANILSISSKYCTLKEKSISHRMREKMLGLISPKYGIISREQMKEFIKDPHLPISEKEMGIICHTNELNGYSYMNEEELKEKYQELITSIKRRYNRAVLAIKKYQDHLLPKQINYEKELKKIEKYFSEYDRKLLEMIYQQKLTETQIAKELGITIFQSRTRILKIKLDVAEILNDEPIAKMFDFNYARKVIDQEDLPLYYTNNDLAKTVYQMLTGETGQKKNTFNEVKEKLALNVPQITLANCCYTVMIAVEKYKRGVRKHKKIPTEQIIDYYQHDQEKMSVEMRHYIEKNVLNNGLSNQENIPNKLIYEIIKYRGENCVDIHQVDYNTAKKLVRNKRLTSSCRRKIKNYFQIPEKEIMNGKDKLKVLKLLSPLYKKIEYQEGLKYLMKKR